MPQIIESVRKAPSGGVRRPPLLASLALVACGCGGESESETQGLFTPSPYDSYEKENVTVIGGEAPAGDAGVTGGSTGTSSAGAGSGSTGTASSTGSELGQTGAQPITVTSPQGSGECVQVGENLCVPVDTTGDWCDGSGGPVDVVVVDGKVVEVICYPAAGSGPEEVIGTSHDGGIDVLQTANRTAVTFDPATNGTPINGDVTVDGNGVSIYGNGPDNTIIDGDVFLSGNAVRLRGVTVTGDLHLDKNRVAIVLCRILGDVVLSTQATNGSVFVENDVFGSFTSESNDNTFTGNRVSGSWSIGGHNNVCDRNFAFSDANGNQLVDAGEVGAALPCP